ncbi:hypothetical protein TrCOL_g5779 [Triparma columacea]|uniref:Uncharacterized protein n=1 Tax=Triparma columacea TaxID=722753 RepID=A0A9W7L396_9STRA|nr:hypothetical protein TrCOL_g5779 [Triparma columacea]
MEEFIDQLRVRVNEILDSGGGSASTEGDGTLAPESVVVTRARHREHISNAVEALLRFEEMASLFNNFFVGK